MRVLKATTIFPGKEVMCQKPGVKPPVLVLYGSQTGNSRAMAKA